MNKSDNTLDYYKLKGNLAKKGYNWWWYFFTARHSVTKEEKTFYIEFLVCKPELSEDQPAIFSKDEALHNNAENSSYLMVNVEFLGRPKGQLQRIFPLSDVEMAKKKLSIKADDCLLTDTLLKGSVKVTKEQVEDKTLVTDSGEISFDLSMERSSSDNVDYGASKLFKDFDAYQMYQNEGGENTLFEGTVILNGEKYVVSKKNCYGFSEKNWNINFTSPWVWFSSDNLVSKMTGKRLNNSVLEIGGGLTKIFGIKLDHKLLGMCNYEGTKFEFEFSKLLSGSKTQFQVEDTTTHIKFHIKQSTNLIRMCVDIECATEDMLWVNSDVTEGAQAHSNLWTWSNAQGEIKLFEKRGNDFKLVDQLAVNNVDCEYGIFEYDVIE